VPIQAQSSGMVAEAVESKPCIIQGRCHSVMNIQFFEINVVRVGKSMTVWIILAEIANIY
jgi:hypothetical protein